MPGWYVLLRAARYLGVAPWDLAERPVGWRDIAIFAESGEIEMQVKNTERAQRKQTKARGKGGPRRRRRR